MSNETASTRRHVETLEYRLDDYHAHLTDAVRERDELAIDAAWGVAQALTQFQSVIFSAVLSLLAFVIAAEFVSRVPAVVIAGFAFGVSSWTARRSIRAVHQARITEKNSLASLPEWKSEADKLWGDE